MNEDGQEFIHWMNKTCKIHSFIDAEEAGKAWDPKPFTLKRDEKCPKK
jgi:hypothetical protein